MQTKFSVTATHGVRFGHKTIHKNQRYKWIQMPSKNTQYLWSFSWYTSHAVNRLPIYRRLLPTRHISIRPANLGGWEKRKLSIPISQGQWNQQIRKNQKKTAPFVFHYGKFVPMRIAFANWLLKIECVNHSMRAIRRAILCSIFHKSVLLPPIARVPWSLWRRPCAWPSWLADFGTSDVAHHNRSASGFAFLFFSTRKMPFVTRQHATKLICKTKVKLYARYAAHLQCGVTETYFHLWKLSCVRV